MADDTFDLNETLVKDTFTIPVELEDTDDTTGAPIKRKSLVTYHFGSDNAKVFTKQEGVTVLDQLESLVVKVRGGGKELGREVLTKEYWKTVRPKHQAAIVLAISNDIYPNSTTSMG